MRTGWPEKGQVRFQASRREPVGTRALAGQWLRREDPASGRILWREEVVSTQPEQWASWQSQEPPPPAPAPTVARPGLLPLFPGSRVLADMPLGSPHRPCGSWAHECPSLLRQADAKSGMGGGRQNRRTPKVLSLYSKNPARSWEFPVAASVVRTQPSGSSGSTYKARSIAMQTTFPYRCFLKNTVHNYFCGTDFVLGTASHL
jgi:hypothetical protein